MLTWDDLGSQFALPMTSLYTVPSKNSLRNDVVKYSPGKPPRTAQLCDWAGFARPLPQIPPVRRRPQRRLSTLLHGQVKTSWGVTRLPSNFLRQKAPLFSTTC